MYIDSKGYRPTQKFFLEVTDKYDFLNKILTFNLDKKWRLKAAEAVIKEKHANILDLCCGTGDLLYLLSEGCDSQTLLIGLDFSEKMLNKAEKKLEKSKLHEIKLIKGDAVNMPFDSRTFEAVTISFGFRNLTFENPDATAHIAEINRVIKDNGKLYILETSQPNNRVIRFFYHLYHNVITSFIGGLLSKNKKAYKYLAYSAINYYNHKQLANKLLEAGFRNVEIKRLMFGAIVIAIANK